MVAVVLVGRAERAESCLRHQAASWKLSLCTVPFLNRLLSGRDFFSLSVLNNDLCSDYSEPVEDLVHLLKDQGLSGYQEFGLPASICCGIGHGSK